MSWAACAMTLLTLPAKAQEPPARLSFGSAPAADIAPSIDAELKQASCVNCSSGGLISPYGGPVATAGCSSCGSGQCVPGREQCPACEPCNCVDRFFCRLYDCICCPDPCYDPRWTPIADSAFFVDAARPQTQVRFRVDYGVGMVFPDRSEYFWARSGGNGRGPGKAELGLSYADTTMYTEAATGRVGVFFETSYRSLDPDFNKHAAGFGDMTVGTKTLLLDCELVQVSLQFKTYLPVGDVGKGLGTGHVSLEPSLLFGIRISQDSFLQAQVAEWIPTGGDNDYAGAILHYHFSWNNLLFRFHPEVPVISTLEFNGWTFQDGAFTALGPNGSFQRAGDYGYFSAGPGLRIFACDKLDFGVGVAFALTEPHWATTLYRMELRLRF
jgi:hypothetical protein